ncbi:MAG: catalase, partial [Pseudomonadota bacterium]
ATLKFDDNLPEELTGGIVQSGASYDALARFSNGSPNAQTPDAKGDTRGMALKVFGVEGEKLFPDPGDPNVQDFIMISAPFFFINSAKNYTKFFEAVNEGSLWKIARIPFYLGLRGSAHAAKMMMQKIANPLETRYWSVVPSQLGTGEARQAIKFSMRPLGPTNSTIPTNPGPNFLREAMKKTLSQGDYQMEFLIQRRGNSGFSVEDSVPEWTEDRAPFERVGVLTIHQQDFDTLEREAYCENQSFNPWHSLEAHKPLGMISRTRRVVYQAIAELRHDMNGTAYPGGLPATEGASE